MIWFESCTTVVVDVGVNFCLAGGCWWSVEGVVCGSCSECQSVWLVYLIPSHKLNLNDSDDNAIGKACKSGFSPFQNKIIDNRTDTATRS